MTRVTEALLRQVPNHVGLPSERQADRTNDKVKFYQVNAGFPNGNVVGCNDGTQIRNHAPSENEHEFVNRKG